METRAVTVAAARSRTKMGCNSPRDAYLHEPRRSFVLISQELTRFLNSAEITTKWAMLSVVLSGDKQREDLLKS